MISYNNSKKMKCIATVYAQWPTLIKRPLLFEYDSLHQANKQSDNEKDDRY